ncbi:putative transcriptional regulator [Desulfosporosinus acidiphilus SJ4]|uniref:Putative transcriptional regulator n=1 Tax=Desulfosporosinus acidiphilus (strain DSM 22704 / JCM 16185 / SJ4) TaxID=646529 RepID=I4DAI9_DESAJ|nr:metalloregulator ArsR/SmtB family transcription factor [Desulfosporosinus acidiphilus]AFM42813.1 putative transcriptional regulator [Desulfosporosinus acidiphilus SJ4]
MVESRDTLMTDVPVCQINCIHEEVVNSLRSDVNRIEGIAVIFKALADDTRLKIVYALSQAELCVCDVAALINSTKSTASYHLRLLNHMGLAKFRKDGKLVYYRLADQHIGNLVSEMIKARSVKEND